MMILLTVINITSLIVMIIVAKVFFDLVNSLGELIVRFVELNNEHFKNQKHLITKANELAMTLKKLTTLPTTMKTETRKLDNTINKLSKTIDDINL